MENMLKTVNVLFESHAAALGLDSAKQLVFTPYDPDTELPAKAVSLFELRTVPDTYRFAEHDREKYLTVMQVDIIMRSRDDFAPVRIRDKVFALLDDAWLDRMDWSDPDHPTTAGEIRFSYQDEEPFSLSGGVKAISMTYELQWWKPREVM